MKQKIYAFSLLLLLSLYTPCAYSQEEVVVVSLSTEAPLSPTYVSSWSLDSPAISKEELQVLEKVLRFDLHENGKMSIIKPNATLTTLDQQTPFGQVPQLATWKQNHILYLVQVKVHQRTLSARVYAVEEGKQHSVDGIALTGNLAQDRHQVHRLSNAIYHALFGSEGIATTRFLYTVRKQLPDGSWISDIWEADYDGANRRQITRNNEYCVTPTYIPSAPGAVSNTFLYVSYKTGQPKIYVAALQDGKGKRLNGLKGNQLMPAINRQRSAIAFISDVTTNPDLFLQGFDPVRGAVGKSRQLFAAYTKTQGTPTFSPDGKQIAFVSNKDGTPRIYLLSVPAAAATVKNEKPTLLTKRNRGCTAPQWSPDGKKIAYCAKVDGIRQIWVYDLEADKEKQLTQGPMHKENPTWAPNSHHLIYNTHDGDQGELYLMHLNQENPTKISSGPGQKRFPSWEPRQK